MAVWFEEGTNERAHGKKVCNVGKDRTEMFDKDEPSVSIPPEKHFSNSHKNSITYVG